MEYESERYAYNQSEGSEYKPTSGPLALQETVLPITVMINDLASCMLRQMDTQLYLTSTRESLKMEKHISSLQ